MILFSNAEALEAETRNFETAFPVFLISTFNRFRHLE